MNSFWARTMSTIFMLAAVVWWGAFVLDRRPIHLAGATVMTLTSLASYLLSRRLE
jgi:hypothetical protein